MRTAAIPELQYKILPLAKVQVEHAAGNKPLACKVRVASKWYQTSQRFWTSFFARFGISDSIFKYYSHQEVFDRIVHVKDDVVLRFCTDETQALAISNPDKPLLGAAEFEKLVRKYKGAGVEYDQGVVTSTYTPISGEHQFKIGPDDFANRYMLETPMDGYGKPSIYLSFLRQVCLNGAVAYAPAFRSEINVGENPAYSLDRALSSFDTDEGYSALRQRFEAAQLSPASLYECLRLYKRLKGLAHKEAVKAFEGVVGNIYDMYGVANLDTISEKKLRLLPAKCRVYDLINLASEVSTHHAKGM
ncbi:MAG: DUF932 domain-containing protein, partial [Nitrososphaerales archaeon]